MGAYAHGALESNNLYWQLNEEEKSKLEDSIIWKYLFMNRKY